MGVPKTSTGNSVRTVSKYLSSDIYGKISLVQRHPDNLFKFSGF